LSPPELIRDAITHAVTDSGREVPPEHASPGVTNLLTIYELLSGRAHEAVQAAFVGRRYAELKGAVADVVVSTLKPIRRRFVELLADPERLDAILDGGAERAHLMAAPTLERVKQLMGLVESGDTNLVSSTLNSVPSTT
jgi:tryptophanyl-tRNA synthetase